MIKYLLILLFIIIISCENDNKNSFTKIKNGVQYITNKNTPQNKKIKINTELIFSIKNNSLHPLLKTYAFDIDSKNYIYILDQKLSQISKYDSNGNYLLHFGSLGNGPGETKKPNSMAILNDTIYVCDYPQKKIVKYSSFGLYLESIKITGGIPLHLESIDNNKFIGYVYKSNRTSKGLYLSYDLTLLDNTFNKIYNFGGNKYKHDIDKPVNYLDLLVPFTFNKKYIYTSVLSKDKYEIKKWNFNGKLLSVVKKYSRRLKFNDYEKESLNKILKKKNKTKKISEFNSIYKNTINNIFIDDSGYLFVMASISRNNKNLNKLLIDVFKDGIFLNNIELDIDKGFDFMNLNRKIKFRNNKIYLLNRENNELKVFNYAIINKEGK